MINITNLKHNQLYYIDSFSYRKSNFKSVLNSITSLHQTEKKFKSIGFYFLLERICHVHSRLISFSPNNAILPTKNIVHLCYLRHRDSLLLVLYLYSHIESEYLQTIHVALQTLYLHHSLRHVFLNHQS